MKNFLHIGEPLVLGSLASDPAGAVPGTLYFNTTLNAVRQYQSGSWVNTSSVTAMNVGSVPYYNGTVLTYDTLFSWNSTTHTLTIGDTNPQSGTSLYILNQVATQPSIRIDSYAGTYPGIDFGSSRGTQSSPSGLVSGDGLLSLRAFGGSGSSIKSIPNGEISISTLNTWSGGDYSTLFTVKTTDISDTIERNALQLTASQLILGGGYLSSQFKTELVSKAFTISTPSIMSSIDASPVYNGISGQLNIQTGTSTGAGTGGEIVFSISNSSSNGYTANSLVEIFRIRNNGTVKSSGLSSDPSSATAGDLYYNTASNAYKFYNGSSWTAITGGSANTSLSNLTSTSINQDLISSSALATNIGSYSKPFNASFSQYYNSKMVSDNGSYSILDNLGAYHINLISSWDGTPLLSAGGHGYVNTLNFYSFDSAIFTTGRLLISGSVIDVNSNNIVNLADPTTAQMAATKNYVDNAISSHSGFANTSLSNLTSTSINQPLYPSVSRSKALGSSSLMWDGLHTTTVSYYDGGGSSSSLLAQYYSGITLNGSQSTAATVSNITFSNNIYNSCIVNYRLVDVISNNVRTGTLMVSAMVGGTSSSSASITDVYDETGVSQVIFSISVSGSNIVSLQYTNISANASIFSGEIKLFTV